MSLAQISGRNCVFQRIIPPADHSSSIWKTCGLARHRSEARPREEVLCFILILSILFEIVPHVVLDTRFPSGREKNLRRPRCTCGSEATIVGTSRKSSSDRPSIHSLFHVLHVKPR